MENLDDAAGLGGRFRAWTGVGPVGFWDPMTITAWERTPDGGGRCEVLHRGAVVRGEGEFAVVARRRGRQPLRVGRDGGAARRGRWVALGWRVVRPVVERLIDRGLRGMRDQVEAAPGG